MNHDATSRPIRFSRRSRWIGVTAAAAVAVGTFAAVGAVGANSPASRSGGQSAEALAAPTAGATFVAVTPYRAFDSRSLTVCTGEPGPIVANDTKIVDVATDGNCDTMIPTENLVAVAYTLTITGTVGSGYLALFPTGSTWPGNSSINWTTPGQELANGGIVGVGDAFEERGFINVQSGPTGQTHFIVDITGYFME